MPSVNPPAPMSPPKLRSLWVVTIVSFACGTLSAVVAMAAGGWGTQAFGMALFVSSLPFYWAYVRLGDYYEGHGHGSNRLFRNIGLAALLIGMVWFGVELARGANPNVEAAKALVFFCFFLNVLQMAMLVLEKERNQPRS